jgi:hypothetical protein
MYAPLRLSNLSPARQALIRLCQEINFGSIENLEVREGEPAFEPSPVVLRDLKLDSEDGARGEIAIVDFGLSKEVVQLMRHLDEIAVGTVRRLEVRAGIPRRLLWESRVRVGNSTEATRGAK